MIPKNKRHLIVNKEYSRLPYWTDDGYEDVQQSVSQKYVQDTYGAFAESENQLPYLSDADYQGLEYQYQNPEFFDSTKLPDIDFKNTIPKGTCYELWVSMFGKGTGGFFPTNSQYAQLMDYAKKCPLIYMPTYCCPKGNMKISGPDKVMPGAEAEYTVTGDLDGCSYSWNAKRGMIVAGRYIAPSTAGSDRIYVTPYLSGDSGKVCGFKDITIEGGCKGKIYALITTMEAGASQTLSVTGGSEYDDYYWTASTGSLSSNEGMSVVYTAPATNPNCANNPTITLTCGGSVVDTITIAVNAFSAFNVGEICVLSSTSCDIKTYPENPYPYNIYYWGTAIGHKDGINCDGTESEVIIEDRVTEREVATGSCTTAIEAALLQLRSWLHLGCRGSFDTWTDLRTPTQKAAGCCPYQLL